jgi:hypothetical protein
MVRITQIVIKTADAVADLSPEHRHQRIVLCVAYVSTTTSISKIVGVITRSYA